MNSITYSLVIPLYNEQESLAPLWEQLTDAMRQLRGDWEAIFVNDGSKDKSVEVLEKLASRHKKIRIISFRRNQGKAAALQAGFRAAQGEIIITMDADLQDDPKEINRLIKKLDDGFDLVSGLKKNRHDPFHKTIPSFFFNTLVRQISGVPMKDINSGLKAYRRPVIQSLSIYGELYRFIPILAAKEGFHVTEIPVNHRPRQYGKSKYGVSRFIRGLLDLFTVTFITKFLKRPLHFFGTIGLTFLLIGVGACTYLTVLHFAFHHAIGDRPLLLLGVLLILAGFQLISTGLIAELITYHVHQRQRQQLMLLNQAEEELVDLQVPFDAHHASHVKK